MCTSITLKAQDGSAIQARTEEWGAFDLVSELMITPQNVDLQSTISDGKPGLKWKSRYGVVGINALHKPYYIDGMNEAGLTARSLYLAETDYGKRDSSKEGLSVSIWVQYYLDNFATVAEAVEASRSLQVVPVKIIHRGQAVDAPQHISLADKTGDSAVIEILGGKMVIHHSPQYTVMTNSPTYDE